jgi:hypothetical protein
MKAALKEGITLGLAIYGALAATYSALLSTYLARVDRVPRLRLSASVTFLYSEDEQEDPEGPILTCTIANSGRTTVTISSVGFCLPTCWRQWFTRKQPGFRMHRPLGDVVLPHSIEPGKACYPGILGCKVAELLKRDGYADRAKLRPYCIDQTGRRYWAKAQVFTIKDLVAPDE